MAELTMKLTFNLNILLVCDFNKEFHYNVLLIQFQTFNIILTTVFKQKTFLNIMEKQNPIQITIRKYTQHNLLTMTKTFPDYLRSLDILDEILLLGIIITMACIYITPFTGPFTYFCEYKTEEKRK